MGSPATPTPAQYKALEAASELATLDGRAGDDRRRRTAAPRCRSRCRARPCRSSCSSGDMRWRIAILVSAAIAISYLDRQTLPVAIKAIEQDIPITNEQFSLLQSAFLIAYAVMYAGGGKLMDVVGTRAGLAGDHDVLVARLRQPRPGDQRRHARRQPAAARHGRGRRLPRRDARRRRMVPGHRAIDGDGHHQRRHRGRRRRSAPPLLALVITPGRLARRLLPHRGRSAWPGRSGGGSSTTRRSGIRGSARDGAARCSRR